MSTYEHDLTARFAALTPRPLPGDWADVLDRAGAVRPRRRRLTRSLWRGGRRRKLVVALAVAVLVAAVAAAAYGTVRVLFLDRGFIGLPPVGATPSAPESGELVLRWSGDSATHAGRDWRGFPNAPYAGAWVYADGRMIWQRDGQVPQGANELTSGYLEQRLTTEGVELLRSEVLRLFDRNRALLETFPAEDEEWRRPSGGLALFVPGDYGSQHGGVEVRNGDRLVRLQWADIGTKRHSPKFEGTIATPEQLSALRQIDALLTNPTSVLPSSAWAVRKVRAYVPSHYAVCIDTSPPKDSDRILSMLPTRAEQLLRDQSWTRSDGEVVEAREGGRTVVLGRSVRYCSKLTTEEAREVANTVSGLARHSWPLSLMYVVAKAVNNLNPTTISFDPYFPHGQFLLFGGGR